MTVAGKERPVKAWSEASICSALARQRFDGSLVLVPNCTWAGHEADLLVVTPKLKLVDVEVKITRADLKRDLDKDKWLKHHPGTYVGGEYVKPEPTPRQWPRRIWKHYYAMPKELWDDSLAASICDSSGVILLSRGRGYWKHSEPVISATVHRQAIANPEAYTLKSEDVVNIARLASLRMWDALKELERSRQCSPTSSSSSTS